MLYLPGINQCEVTGQTTKFVDQICIWFSKTLLNQSPRKLTVIEHQHRPFIWMCRILQLRNREASCIATFKVSDTPDSTCTFAWIVKTVLNEMSMCRFDCGRLLIKLFRTGTSLNAFKLRLAVYRPWSWRPWGSFSSTSTFLVKQYLQNSTSSFCDVSPTTPANNMDDGRNAICSTCFGD